MITPAICKGKLDSLADRSHRRDSCERDSRQEHVPRGEFEPVSMPFWRENGSRPSKSGYPMERSPVFLSVHSDLWKTGDSLRQLFPL